MQSKTLQFGSVFSTLCVDGFVMVSSRLFVQLISYGHDPYAIMWCSVRILPNSLLIDVP
jgi:hypothetical protein